MIRVDSSIILSVGYDGDLYVKFTAGGLYTFFTVPRSVYIGLIGAKSTGRYFTENVKDRYEFSSKVQD